MAQVQFEVVLGTEALRVNRLRNERADVVIVSSMLAMEFRSRWLDALTSDLEL